MVPSPKLTPIEEYKNLVNTSLPEAAKRRDPSQAKWPVYLNHCFGRIILDNVVGAPHGKPWMGVVKPPAVHHMSVEQLDACVSLGRMILSGEADLGDLNRRSLELRGKSKEASLKGVKRVVKPEATSDRVEAKSPWTIASAAAKAQAKAKAEATSATATATAKTSSAESPNPEKVVPNNDALVQAISVSTKRKAESISAGHDERPTKRNVRTISSKIGSDPTLTPFARQVLLAICQIPPGRYSTYGALSTFLGSSPRAVGNALRRNPFPFHFHHVEPIDGAEAGAGGHAGFDSSASMRKQEEENAPCHRILGADGTIGGFKGDVDVAGENVKEKLALLQREGVKFRSGKAVGSPFTAFK